MNFFKNLFGKKDSGYSTKFNEFLKSAEVKNLKKKYRRSAVALRPRAATSPLSPAESKFGGRPNAIGFQEYPQCASCKTPLNFVLQLYKRDVPEFYFPEQKDLFQLFRCPNYDCPDASNDKYDLATYHYYFRADNRTAGLENPGHNLKEAEQLVPDCTLHPETINDYPNPDDYEDGALEQMQEKYGEELLESFFDEYSAAPNTKFGGYPSFTQYPHYPHCSCGKKKEFFFQLSSDDSTGEKTFPNFEWSPHGIMIGDVGNVYFYVCKSCGPETIETFWDCS